VAVAAVGGRARLVTVLGGHPLAALALADLEANGVEVVDVLPARVEPPAVSAVTVRERDGERTVVSHNAGGLNLDATWAPACWVDAVSTVGAVLVDGHHPALALAAAATARRVGVPVVLDAGSWKPVLADLLPLVDICACADSFRLPGHPGVESTDRALHELGVPVVTRTHGPAPVRWSVAERGRGAHRLGEDEVRHVSGEVVVPRVAARDTVAAGDIWHGVFAHAVALLGSVPTAAELPSLVERANEVAALRVRYSGPRAWLAHLRRATR
jgi:sugar/nucleoside kinase (ribokinase family)